MTQHIVHPGATMKFRVRPGYMLFRSQDEMDLFKAGGELARGVRPRAVAGQEVELNALERAELGDRLGMFEPACADAIKHYSDVKPIFHSSSDEGSVMTAAEVEKARVRGGRITVKSTGEHL